MSGAPAARLPAVLRPALLVLWCAVVWHLSDQPNPRETVGFLADLPDWLLHGVEYAVGGFLARNALRPLLGPRGSVVALLFCVLWAVLDEWHQSFVPGRDVEVHDVLADAAGSLVGILLHRAWRRGDPS